MKLTHANRKTLVLLIAAAGTGAFGQAPERSKITVNGVHITGVSNDWSNHHLIFSNPGAENDAIANKTHEQWLKIVNDPRYVLQQVQRRQPAQGPATAQVAGVLEGVSATTEPVINEDPATKKHKHRDWSMDLGPGNGGAEPNTYPAKWSFSTVAANCFADFVVYPTFTTGSTTQATIAAYNNLYSGCGGSVPNAYWQYNTGADSAVTSPVLSLDGSQVTFVQSSGSNSAASLVILKWAVNPAVISLSNTTPASYRGCAAPCMTVITFSNGAADQYSSPFYDYADDVLYIGDKSTAVHKFAGVFNGTPTEAGSPWPVKAASNGILSSPVLDPVSGRVFVGSSSGYLYAINSSTGAIVGTSSQIDFEYGLRDGPLVDSAAGTLYAFAGSDGKSNCADGHGLTGCSGVFQFPVAFTSGSGAETQVGYGLAPLFSGAFDNAYYTSNSSSPTGHLYVCGQTDVYYQQTLNQIQIASNVMGSETVSPYSIGDGDNCSPVTEFYNTSTSSDYIFLSSPVAYQGCAQNTGCLFAFSVSSATVPDAAAFTAEANGAGGVIVDNSIGAGTLPGASQLYFTTLGSLGTCATSGGTGICGVQMSQTGLYVDWSEFHFTPDHEGVNEYESVLGPGTVGNLGVQWSDTTGASILYSSPAVVNGVVYVGSEDYKIYAFNATNGALLWSYATGAPVISSPAVANGVVYVGSIDNKIYALNAGNGAVVWSYTTGGGVQSSPAVANGLVYASSYDGKIYALNGTNGAFVWSYSAGNSALSSPAVANGVVYVGSAAGTIYALNATSGALQWAYDTGSAVQSSPAVANGVVYASCTNATIYALNATNGAFLWTCTTGGEVYSSPAVANGVVYVGSDDAAIYALNATNGAFLWRYATGGEVYSSPAVANGVVYVGSDDNKIYSLNATNGLFLWSYTTGGEVYSSPAVANGVVYVGSLDDKIYAFALP